ncbi:hypothetical protein TYRP_017658 [Tyrophagus putrescentiae]|nr:hypothetical protein TYRP_017658 [Tyrophagus putrescentiae]
MIAKANESSTKKNKFKCIVAGGLTGATEACISYPTEYIKTQLQLDKRSAHPRYNGIIDVAQKTIQNHGVLGLYRGLSVLVVGQIPQAAIRFGVFETLKSKMAKNDGHLPSHLKVLCGFAAGVTEAVLVVTPKETIKVKFIDDLNNKKPKYRGLFHGIHQITREHGLKGIYQGLTPTILKYGSNQAIRFFVVETLKEWFSKKENNKSSVNKLATFTFGMIAGAVSVYGNNPIDVIKTRLQGLESAKYRSTWDCFVKIVKHEGPLALYKGCVPRLGRACLDAGITFTMYDTIIELIN